MKKELLKKAIWALVEENNEIKEQRDEFCKERNDLIRENEKLKEEIKKQSKKEFIIIGMYVAASIFISIFIISTIIN